MRVLSGNDNDYMANSRFQNDISVVEINIERQKHVEFLRNEMNIHVADSSYKNDVFTASCYPSNNSIIILT